MNTTTTLCRTVRDNLAASTAGALAVLTASLAIPASAASIPVTVNNYDFSAQKGPFRESCHTPGCTYSVERVAD